MDPAVPEVAVAPPQRHHLAASESSITEDLSSSSESIFSSSYDLCSSSKTICS
jgi:hypothetical protein